MIAKRSTLNDSTGLAEFLVDSNILVYALDARDPEKLRRSREVLDTLVLADRGVLTAQVLSEFYSALRKKDIVPHDVAERAVMEYSRSWLIFDVKLEAVLEAVRGVRDYKFSYFDSLIWATAKLNGVPNILSEDGQDGQSVEGVRRINPLLPSFDMATLS